ncbi:hypothetical protein [Caproicibacter fermentans]|uniref:Uncharacterized protein n=1 Tax=Caproicibacter fermentans TaxID=2576756 RepID=A0A7G8TF67_9FIRM|nr:hypothetical protein [Caproicibacter fermentans]QNK42258.1 hypothetical protein HCR03_08645 [Caproicibacter fermentans]
MLKFKKKLAALFCAAALMVTFAVPAFAASYSYDYTFSGSGESWGYPDGYYSKEDNEQNAYLSIHNSSNWARGVDRVYLWAQFSNNQERTSSNRYFTDYVTNALLPYTTYTAAGNYLGLAGWHNNYNNPKTFSVGGLWTP